MFRARSEQGRALFHPAAPFFIRPRPFFIRPRPFSSGRALFHPAAPFFIRPRPLSPAAPLFIFQESAQALVDRNAKNRLTFKTLLTSTRTFASR
jgi:hypothetical protein